jgi:CHRD domain
MPKWGLVLSAFAAAGLLAACEPLLPPPPVPQIDFVAFLSGPGEVPPTPYWGGGTATANLNLQTSILRWHVNYWDLTGPPIAAHIHCGAAVGHNGPIAVPFNNSLASPIVGIASVNSKEIAELLADQCYINIHTLRYKGGEIRGQLVRTD